MRPNGILIALLSAAALFILNGRADAKDESFSAYVEHAGKILKNDVCPRLGDETEKVLCNKVEVKASTNGEFGIAAVSADGCNAIYIDRSIITLFDAALSDDSLRVILAHEIGHIVSQKCLVSGLVAEFLSDLYSAKIFGSEIAIQTLKQIYGAMTPASRELAYILEIRIKMLKLSGW